MRRKKGEVRRKILEELQKGPRSFGELRRAIGCSDRVVFYNLKKLEGEGLVKAEEVRGERKWTLSLSFWKRKAREAIEKVPHIDLPVSQGGPSSPPSFLFSENPDPRLHEEFRRAILSILRLQLGEKLDGWKGEEVEKALGFAAGCFFLWRADFPKLLREREWVTLFAPGFLEGAGRVLTEEEWEGLPRYARLSLAEILVDMLREADPETTLGGYLGRLGSLIDDPQLLGGLEKEIREVLARFSLQKVWEEHLERESREGTFGGDWSLEGGRMRPNLPALFWKVMKEVPRDPESLRAWMGERKEAFRKLLREIKEIRFCFVGGWDLTAFKGWPFDFTLPREVEDFLELLRDPKIRWDDREVQLFALREYARRAAEELERNPGAKLPEVRDDLTKGALRYAFGQDVDPQEWPEMLERHYPQARLPGWWRMFERLLTEALRRIPPDGEILTLLERYFSTVYSSHEDGRSDLSEISEILDRHLAEVALERMVRRR